MTAAHRNEETKVIQVDFGEGGVAALRQRLRRATADMAMGLAKQKCGMEEFRLKMDELGEKITAIDRSLEVYRGKLAAIEIKRLGRKSRRLARIMDSYPESA